MDVADLIGELVEDVAGGWDYCLLIIKEFIDIGAVITFKVNDQVLFHFAKCDVLHLFALL